MSLKDRINKLFNKKNENNLIDADNEIAINVEHLTMEFKITKDKIDTLKEYVIRTLKKNKKEKQKIKVLEDISFKVYRVDRV